MKKFIETLFGAKQHASAKNIRGRKSRGNEDLSNYNAWRQLISKSSLWGNKYDID